MDRFLMFFDKYASATKEPPRIARVYNGEVISPERTALIRKNQAKILSSARIVADREITPKLKSVALPAATAALSTAFLTGGALALKKKQLSLGKNLAILGASSGIAGGLAGFLGNKKRNKEISARDFSQNLLNDEELSFGIAKKLSEKG